MNRRHFIKVSAAVAGFVSRATAVTSEQEPEPGAAKLPRWRGFNLLEKFFADRHRPFVEADFAYMAEWGFNFARLPLSYRCWCPGTDWHTLREPVLKDIDQAVEFGRRYHVHVNINFHRAPGYCVNSPAELLDLWK